MERLKPKVHINTFGGFSPVAGIKVVESLEEDPDDLDLTMVSVPLPGLRSWKEFAEFAELVMIRRFSPVAGIKVVESWRR